MPFTAAKLGAVHASVIVAVSVRVLGAGLLVMLNRQALTIHQVVFSFRPGIGTREEVSDLDQ